ncbi:MAG: YihA family ribosome biogenesis GTP-binding protein [Candidatus Zixiibacteriota bacterium]|nr:MAG: YihA family ribosome biogenesis GTP-binding protein [candidate division Zixibacteria bacterium]
MWFANAEYVGSFFKVEDIPKTGYPEIAFAGRSNVGKSTLINKILNRKKLAQVSKTPGKTRALNYFEIDHKYYFVDLPGFGYAKISKKDRERWGKLIESYFKTSKKLKGVIHIIDSRRGLMDSDRSLKEYIDYFDIEVLWVLSKVDKLKNQARADIYKNTLHELNCSPQRLMFFSAVDGLGVTEIKKLIMEILKR